MAPLTRMRASNPEHAPTQLHAEYYAQRASAGLIIGECTEISPDAYGWADTPGLWSAEQVRGWGRVTDAVHKKGGLMYAQLWHTGAMSHPDFFNGALPMSASNVNPQQESVTPSGKKPTVAPRPMTEMKFARRWLILELLQETRWKLDSMASRSKPTSSISSLNS